MDVLPERELLSYSHPFNDTANTTQILHASRNYMFLLTTLYYYIFQTLNQHQLHTSRLVNWKCLKVR